MKNKKVIVTGGMGFIGSHLTERLLENNEVTVIDNESTGKIENIRHLLDHQNLTVITQDSNRMVHKLNWHGVFGDI